MRTTLSIDDDIAQTIENLRIRDHLSLRQVINQLLRAGIQAQSNQPSSTPYHGKVFDSKLRSGIDPNRMNQLVDELEIEQHSK